MVPSAVAGLQGLALLGALRALWAGVRFAQFLQHALRTAQAVREGAYADAADGQAFPDSQLDAHLQAIGRDARAATKFAVAVGEGNFSSGTEGLNETSGLGKALAEMQTRLVTLSEEEKQRNWLVSGQAKFGELLRSHQSSDLAKLSAAFIEGLAHYLEARQGAVYLLEEEGSEKSLHLAAGYACARGHQQRLAWQEGLVGASVYDQETICVDNAPEDYIQISSALGATPPANILIVPVKHNERVYGAVELASIHPFPDYQVKFVETLCSGFASSIEAATFNTTTQRLLKESQQSADELRMKEETLRQNAEELLATQEELNRKLAQIEQESALTTSIVQAINKTNASLELDMEGNIIDVNDMYLSLMEYTRDELIGKPEKGFVSKSELEGQRYDLMWESIRTGAYNSGEFKRISKSGRELWLTGTYSPIFDVEGKPYKIVQFAQFTTEQKEKELELISKIEALNLCVPLVEINLDCEIITANSVFLQAFGFKRIELRRKGFKELLDPKTLNEEFDELWASLVAGGVGQKTLCLYTKTGEARYFIASFSSSKNLEGHVYRILAVLSDITEQLTLREQLNGLLTEEKRKNAILEMQAETTDQFIEEISDVLIRLEDRYSKFDLTPILQRKKLPIVEFSPDGDIKLINQAAGRLLGIDPSRTKHTSFFDLLYFSSPDEFQYFRDRIEQPELIQLKLQFRTINNTNLRFNAYLAPHFTGDDDSYYLVMMIMNVEDIAAESGPAPK
jgi:PAS domain S-box-containing protein